MSVTLKFEEDWVEVSDLPAGVFTSKRAQWLLVEGDEDSEPYVCVVTGHSQEDGSVPVLAVTSEIGYLLRTFLERDQRVRQLDEDDVDLLLTVGL